MTPDQFRTSLFANEDVVDLYERVKVGTRVVVLG
jgi:hypothetical protein